MVVAFLIDLEPPRALPKPRPRRSRWDDEKNATYDGSKVLPTVLWRHWGLKTCRAAWNAMKRDKRDKGDESQWWPVTRPVTFKVTALGRARRYVRHTYGTEQGQVDNAVDRIRSLSPQSPVGQAVLPVLAFDSSWTVSNCWSVLKYVEKCWKYWFCLKCVKSDLFWSSYNWFLLSLRSGERKWDTWDAASDASDASVKRWFHMMWGFSPWQNMAKSLHDLQDLHAKVLANEQRSRAFSRANTHCTKLLCKASKEGTLHGAYKIHQDPIVLHNK